jgi:membrane associated rhomboid family serine protease
MLPLWDDEPHRRAPVVTALLIAVNIAVFGYELFLLAHGQDAFRRFVETHALVPRRLLGNLGEGGQWLTVLTSMFLHGGFAHVLGNCWFLWVFGNNIEDKLGPFRFLAFYLVCGAAAAAAQVLAAPSAVVPMVGASGAISGVLGAYLLLFPFALIYTLVPWIVPILPIPALVFLVVWFGVQSLQGYGSLMRGDSAAGGVAWWAHIGGFAAGFGLLLLLKRKGGLRRKPARARVR